LLASELLAVDDQASKSEQEASAVADWARLEADIKANAMRQVASPAPSPAYYCASASPAQLAAESLAAATGGAVVAEVVADPKPDASQLLTDEQKAVCVEMIKALSTDGRKAFTIAFRDAFQVPREAKAIAPLITEVRHMEFCDRWSVEASGGVAP